MSKSCSGGSPRGGLELCWNEPIRGYLVIYPSGQTEAWSSLASNAQRFTSLAGISFPLGS